MTKDQIVDRLNNIIEHMYDSSGGEKVPLCHILDHELTPDEHDDIHAIFMTITAIGTKAGFMMASQYAAYAFTVGRKWGLMEAAETLSMDVPDAPE